MIPPVLSDPVVNLARELPGELLAGVGIAGVIGLLVWLHGWIADRRHAREARRLMAELSAAPLPPRPAVRLPEPLADMPGRGGCTSSRRARRFRAPPLN